MFGFAGMLLGVPTMALIYYLIGRFSRYLLRKRELPEDTEEYINLERIDPKSHVVVEHTEEYMEQTHVNIFHKKEKATGEQPDTKNPNS